MRARVITVVGALLLGIAGPASAQSAKKKDVNFWEWLVDPHAAELKIITTKVDQTLNQLGSYTAYDYTGAFSLSGKRNRMRLLSDLEGMIRYAIRLDPDRIDLYRRLGYLTHDAGKIGEARRALEHYLDEQLPEKIDAEARVRLGQIYAAQQEWEDAVVQLRLAIGSNQVYRNTRQSAVFTLANVYMHSRRLAEAIDLLDHNSETGSYFGMAGDPVLRFALAVAYDRDEQLTLAHETLDKLLSIDEHFLYSVLNDENNQPLVFTPLIDRHYYAAMQFEALGKLNEARTEWEAYARTGDDTPYRERALEHAKRIDAMLEKQTEHGDKIPVQTGVMP